MIDNEKIKAIIKQYADKGKKMYSETIDSRGSRYNAGFWDGYECCAKGLLRELEDMQEEPEYLEEETTYCAFSTSRYTDKERKALCKGCEEECEFNKKEDSVSEQKLSNVERTGKNWKEAVSEAAEDYSKSTLVGSPYIKKNAFKAGADWQLNQIRKENEKNRD